MARRASFGGAVLGSDMGAVLGADMGSGPDRRTQSGRNAACRADVWHRLEPDIPVEMLFLLG